MEERAVLELEQAAQIVLAPPNIVTAEQRQTAENVFLAFKKTSMPYNLCRHILETCKNEYVLFQVASTIKESVVREWSLLQPQDVESLRTYLLHYITQHMSLQSYVREQILQAVAVIFKRGTVDERYTDRKALFSDVTQLIASGNHSMQLIACSILTALLNEYSSTVRSSSVGLPWEFHYRCKTAFEQNDLKQVFLFCLQVLQELEKLPSPLDREVTAVFNRFLAITEQVLCWEFLPKHLPRRLIGSFLGNQNVSFKPPLSWRVVVLDESLVQLLIRIHLKVRYNSEMAHHSLMCLTQLATMNGPIFADNAAKTCFLTSYLEAFLHMITSTQLQDYEALGIANIISSLLMFFPTSVFTSLTKDLLIAFLQNLAKLTCNFCQAAAQEDALHKDDTLFLEAYEKVLTSWMSFISEGAELPDDILQKHAIEIFNTYLQCHLSPPDGTRNQSPDGGAGDADEEYDDIDEDDRERFKDQLCSIGLFGRHYPSHTIPLLSRLLEDRIGRLNGQLQRVQQCRTLSPGGAGTAEVDSSIMNNLNEDIHWLILIVGNILTSDTEGETPMIPSDIMNYSSSQMHKTDLGTTLKVLSSPGNSLRDIPGGEQASDPVVRLISSVFRLCEVERRAIESNLAIHLSPEVSGTTMWFLSRWVPAYLLPDESYYQHISVSLNTSFGRDTEGGQWTVSYLVEKVLLNLVTWTSESALLKDTLQLFLSMVDKKDRSKYVLKCDSMWKLVKDFSANQQQFDILPSECKRLMCQALVLAGSSAIDNDKKEQYWKLVLHSLYEQYKSVIHQPGFVKQSADEGVRRQVISLLECLCGVASGSRIDNVMLLFQFLHPAMVDSIVVLDVYHMYEDIVQLVLELFDSVVNRQICYLNESDTKKLYDSCLSMIQMYAKNNVGRRVLSKDAEEEQFQDILTLIQLLTNALSKDFIDFGDKDNEELAVSAADVALYGLNIIIPLMNEDLLKFPSLCTSYMRLLTYIGEIYPEKVCQLPEHLLKIVMASQEMGLSNYATDIVKLSMEFLTSVAAHVHQHHLEGTMVYESMAHFLELLFNMLLLETFDMELLETAGTAYFTLICCHQERYRSLVDSLLEKQTDSAIHQRLVEAFNTLTDGLQLNIDRQNRIMFRMNFDNFLINVRGLLCVK